jgi:hypothetical protein
MEELCEERDCQGSVITRVGHYLSGLENGAFGALIFPCHPHMMGRVTREAIGGEN